MDEDTIMHHGNRSAERLKGGDFGMISDEEQASREAERVGRLEKKARSGSLDSQLFAAIRIPDKNRVNELLQSGANANASEPAPLWLMAGTLLMPCILCCAFSSPQHYSRPALHVAMIQGDTDVVKLLLDSGADHSAPEIFWNCCFCCSWRAQSASLQSNLMGNPDTGSATSELGDPVPWAKQVEMKQMVMQRA